LPIDVALVLKLPDRYSCHCCVPVVWLVLWYRVLVEAMGSCKTVVDERTPRLLAGVFVFARSQYVSFLPKVEHKVSEAMVIGLLANYWKE
jgi:hypothetical protein